jgi:hypothetical protein
MVNIGNVLQHALLATPLNIFFLAEFEYDEGRYLSKTPKVGSCFPIEAYVSYIVCVRETLKTVKILFIFLKQLWDTL